MDSFSFIILRNLLYCIGVYSLRESAVQQISLLHCILNSEEGFKMPLSELFTYRPWFLVRSCVWHLWLPVVWNMLMNGQSFCGITLCQLVNSHRRFGRVSVFSNKHIETLRFSEPSLNIGPRQGKACQDIYLYHCSLCDVIAHSFVGNVLIKKTINLFWHTCRT